MAGEGVVQVPPGVFLEATTSPTPNVPPAENRNTSAAAFDDDEEDEDEDAYLRDRYGDDAEMLRGKPLK